MYKYNEDLLRDLKYLYIKSNLTEIVMQRLKRQAAQHPRSPVIAMRNPNATIAKAK